MATGQDRDGRMERQDAKASREKVGTGFSHKAMRQQSDRAGSAIPISLRPL